MASITFETHQFISTLIEPGFYAKQTEAVSAIFKVAQSDSDSASNCDFREMELRLEAKIDNVTADLKGDLINARQLSTHTILQIYVKPSCWQGEHSEGSLLRHIKLKKQMRFDPVINYTLS